MKIQIFKVQKEKGFRINLVDIIFILLLILSSFYIYEKVNDIGYYFLLPLYVGFTFFLFCNLFRLRTKDEILWVFFFLISSLLTMQYFENHWVLYTILLSFSFQSILIMRHFRSEGYRGIWY